MKTILPSADEIERVKKLVDQLCDYAPIEVVACRGDKCREPWCVSCYGEEAAAAGLQQVTALVGELRTTILALGCRAAPTPPAAEAPGQPVALTVDDVEQIIISTESTESDAVWTRRMAKALHARLVSAPPTYADAEAKGFERGIEAAAKDTEIAASEFNVLWNDNIEPTLNMAIRDALFFRARRIRSLASPAPKGEGQ